MTEKQLNAWDRRIAEGRDWSGYLTIANFDAVVERIRSMIGDGQPYTWVMAHEGYGYRPEVRTGQKAEEITVHDRRDDWAHFSVRDTYGVWGLHTHAADESAVKALPEKQRTGLTFERRSRTPQLVIAHYAPIGDFMYWVIAPEGGDR